MVDNSQEPNSRWYTGSGIYREVHLLTGPAVHIEPTWPRVTIDGDVVTVRTKVTNTTDADTTAEVAGVVTGPQGDEHPLAAQTVDIPSVVKRSSTTSCASTGHSTGHRHTRTSMRPGPWSVLPTQVTVRLTRRTKPQHASASATSA